MREQNVRRPLEELVTLLPSVSLDMKVTPVLWRSKLFPGASNAIVRQTKDVVSEHPRVCMHDQHFGIRSSDLNLRLRSAQKAAGGFVGGEKLLRMSEAEKNYPFTSPNKSFYYAGAHNKDRDSPAELSFPSVLLTRRSVVSLEV